MRTIENGGFQASRILAALIAPLALAMTVAAAGPPSVKSSKPIVSEVIVRDSRHVSGDTIKDQMKTRVGGEFDEATLQADVRALYMTRRFAKVCADKSEDGPGRIKVVVTIRDYTSVIGTITFAGGSGVELTEGDLSDIAFLRIGMPCNPIVNEVACQNIARHFRNAGYPSARCDLALGGSWGDSEVKFDITVGERAPK